MNTDTADDLLHELEQLGAQLRGLAEEVATELRRGAQARITEIDIRRPQILRLLAELNAVVFRCGGVPGGERGNALTAAMNFYRPQPGFWGQCDDLLRMQLPPRRRALMRGQRSEPSLNSTQNEAANTLLDVLHFALKADAQSEDAIAHGCHDDIPLASSNFFAAAHAAYRALLAQDRAKGARFLDVGCGNGMKLLSAAPYFDQCDGLEYQDTSVQAAEQLLTRANAARCRVFQGDAMQFDGYDGYEVIYLYRPMRDANALAALEDRIVAHAQDGTLIIAPYFDFHQRAAELGCGRLAGDVFLIGVDQAGADRLREAAEFTGLGLDKTTPPIPSLWDPILQVSAARGFPAPSSSARFVE